LRQDEKRGYQAEVYLALATIIQAITLTALGTEVGRAIREMAYPELLWSFVTGLLSLALCITFWYVFVRDYFFGYRAIDLTAMNHLMIASAIFTIGFLQFIAFQFLEDPRLWLTLVLLSLGVVFVNSWYITNHVTFERDDIQEAIHYDPGSRYFNLSFLAALGCLLLWYALPGIDTAWFRGITLGVVAIMLALFVSSSVKIFERQQRME
jgi:hypothetical protein